MPYLRVDPVAATEGAGFIDLLVTLDVASTNEVRVNYDTGVGTATYGSSQPDFQRNFGTLVFAAGEKSKTVRVTVNNDTGIESTELFWFELASAVNATVEHRYTPVFIHDNDGTAGTPAIVTSDVIVDEEDATASFFVWLSQPSTLPVSVGYSTTNLTASAGSDYTAASGLLSFAPGETVKTVTVALTNDSLAEADEYFRLQLANPSNATLGQSGATATLAANDAPVVGAPAIGARVVSAAEGQTLLWVAVELSAPSTNEVRVNFDTGVGTATYGSATPDFQRHFGTLVFAPGQTSQLVAVPVLNDSNAERTEVAWLELASPVNGTVLQRYTPIVLHDNDATAGTPVIRAGDLTVDEQAGTASFPVWLSRPSTSSVSVAYTTADGTAQAGSDYLATSGTLSFLPGEMVKTVVVDLVDDGSAESDERFGLLLSSPGNATLTHAFGTATIGANDAPPVGAPYVSAHPLATDESQPLMWVEVQLSAPSSNEVRVNFDTGVGTATYGSATPDFQRHFGTLVFEPGETMKTVAVALVDDGGAEDTGVAWFELASPVNAVVTERFTPILMLDNDSTAGTPAISVGSRVVDERTGSASFFVQLNRPFTSAVSVQYSTVDGTASAGSDYRATQGTLHFAPGEVVKTVAVDLFDDSVAETDETLLLQLSAPVNASLVHAQGTLTLGANDAPPVGAPYISARWSAADDSQPLHSVVVQLSAPSSNEVRVNFDTGVGTATYGSATPDFQRHFGTLVFAPGETTRTVSFALVDDSVAEKPELAWLELASPVNAVVTQRYTPFLLHDNDAVAGVPVVSVRDGIVDELAGVAQFVVALDKPSTLPVTVAYGTADESARAGEDYRATAGTLTFAPGETVMTVTVDVHADTLAEPDEFFRLQLASPGNATLGDAVGGALIGRNDMAPVARPQLQAFPITVAESDVMAAFVVQLSAPSTNEVRVNFDTSVGSATYGSATPDFQRHFGTLVFAPGETTRLVPLALVDDTLAEGIETFGLSLASAVNATIAQSQVSATVIDDDSGFRVFSGGFGNDRYSVTSVLDRIAESPRGGIDTVTSGVSYTLPENVENLLLTGSAANGLGNAGPNVFRGNAANNSIDGGAGIDTMVFAGPRAAYSYGGSTAQRTVTGEGSDTLFNVERLQFSDMVLAGDTQPGQNTYLAYAMLNAAFGAAPSTALLSQWVAQLDRLGSTLDLAQAMITHYAPGVPDDVLVTHLWGTIIGGPIPLDALMLYTGLVADGTFTQASLLELVATLEFNTAEIVGIVGQPLVLDPAYFDDLV